MRTPVDNALASLGRVRRVGMSVPSFLLLPGIALAGAREAGLAVLDPPLALEPLALCLARHRRSDRDMAVRFVADRIVGLLAERDP